MSKPLNVNLAGKALPSLSSTQLVKTLFIGDSQFGQSQNRLMGQIQKWDVPFIGRFLGMESQSSTGIGFSGVSGAPGGLYGTANITNIRLELGQDWGDGNTGTNFHHGRKISTSPGIDSGGGGTNFQQVAASYLVPGAYTRPINLGARYYAKVAAYDPPTGGWGAFRITEKRTAISGSASDVTMTASGGVVIVEREVRNTFGTNTEVGVFIRDSFGSEADRSIHLMGTLLYQSPSGSDFPSTGFLPFQISQAGWSASTHLATVTDAAIDAAITMMQGFDTVMIMLGHNSEASGDFRSNIAALKARYAARHTALGYAQPGFVFIAPWNISVGVGQIERLRVQADALYDLALETGDGFINLLDFYSEAQPNGALTTPRGSATYTLDGSLVHPNDSATATLIAQDIEWHFDPANQVRVGMSGQRSRDRSRER